MGWLEQIEWHLQWVLTYPLFPIQVLLFLLASWRMIGAELGVERLIWNESREKQFSAGFGVALLFGVVLYVRYLLDFRSEETISHVNLWVFDRIAPPGATWTLFPSRDEEIRRVGAVLLWGLPGLGLLFVTPKLWAGLFVKGLQDLPPYRRAIVYLKARRWTIPWVVGYAVGVAFACAIYWVDEGLGVRDGIRSVIFEDPEQSSELRITSAVTTGEKMPVTEQPLHAVATLLLAVAIGMIVIIWVAVRVQNNRTPGRALASPVVYVCLVGCVFDLSYGWLTFNITFPLIIVGGGVLALIAWNSPAVFPANRYKMTFPGMAEDHRSLADRTRTHGPGEILGEPSLPLLKDEDVLAAMHARWRVRHPDGTRPKLVVVAVSGGGIRAAVWTAVVLERLEQELGDSFRDHIRLFTGASGGMVGATLYVADFDRDRPDRGTPQPLPEDTACGLGLCSGTLSADSLTQTVQTMVLRDFGPTLVYPPGKSATVDRGRTLEEIWVLNARARGYGADPGPKSADELASLRGAGRRLSPFDRTFADLHPLEAQGLRPSIIFSPMLVEDSRRLLISNLDVSRLTHARGRHLGSTDPVILSQSGAEFFRRFPSAHTRFTIATAARMNATFPVISPAVSLPTDPPRRVVDAGYFDNYGIDLMAEWLTVNREALLTHTAGVALIEIRAFPLQDRGAEFCAEDPEHGEAGGLLSDALALVSTPLNAVLRARGNVCYHRNNERLSALHGLFNPTSTEQFFATAVFEFDRDAALNWYLSTIEKQTLAEAFRLADTAGKLTRIGRAVRDLREWFGSGGG